MKNHPDILQHRIEIAAIYGIQRQAAAERIGGEQDKKQETEGDHSHHRQHPRYRVGGIWRLKSATANVHTLSSSTHSSKEPSCAPQVAATLYHTGSALLEFSAT